MQEWAKNTGRWSEGDLEPNYAQLKTRLRCAFNKAPDIEEMREFHRTKAEEPYKVYKFIPRKGNSCKQFTIDDLSCCELYGALWYDIMH